MHLLVTYQNCLSYLEALSRIASYKNKKKVKI